MANPPKPNDQRANVKNPNNEAYDADQENRAKQAQGNAPAAAPAPKTMEPAKPDQKK